MAVHNIRERRAYIKSLINNGERINIKELIKMWDSSYPSITADLAAVCGEPRPYQKAQWKVQNERSRRLGVTGEITEAEWNEVLRQHNSKCASCQADKDIVIDHIVPLSKGGTNTKDNIQPLCRSCNSSKSDKTPEEWEVAKANAARINGKRGGRPRKS